MVGLEDAAAGSDSKPCASAECPRVDSDVLKEAFERHFEPIYRYCSYRLFAKEAAEDAAATVFLRLAERIDTLNNARDERSLRSWLFAVARTVIKDRIRKSMREKDGLARLSQARRHDVDVRSQRFGDMDWATLHGFICRLKPSYQDVLVMRYAEGMRTKDIAEALGTTPGAVRLALLRARRKLRRLLEASFGRGLGGESYV